jgi:Spy/CpxP family protein refolding chaperone
MSDTTKMLLFALGFAVAGSGGTALGFAIARGGDEPAASSAAQEDTAPPRHARRSATRRSHAKAASRGAGRSARGRGMGMSGGQGRGRSWANIADELDLSDAQRQAWQAMISDIRADCATNRLQQGDTTLELLGRVASTDEVDAEALHAQVETRLDAQREAAHCVLNEVLEFQATLTPEQRGAIAERVTEAQERRKAWLDAWTE